MLLCCFMTRTAVCIVTSAFTFLWDMLTFLYHNRRFRYQDAISIKFKLPALICHLVASSSSIFYPNSVPVKRIEFWDMLLCVHFQLTCWTRKVWFFVLVCVRVRLHGTQNSHTLIHVPKQLSYSCRQQESPVVNPLFSFW